MFELKMECSRFYYIFEISMADNSARFKIFIKNI